MRKEDQWAGVVGPLKAFVILICVLATLAVITMFVSPSDSVQITTSGTAIAPDHSLTNAEAISRFKELDAVRVRGYRQRSTSTALSAFTTDSPIRRRVKNEIERLRRDGVIDKTRFETQDISVFATSTTSIEIQQTVLIDPKFVSEVNGEDLTERDRQQRQEIEWVLRVQAGEWLIHDATVVKADML